MHSQAGASRMPVCVFPAGITHEPRRLDPAAHAPQALRCWVGENAAGRPTQGPIGDHGLHPRRDRPVRPAGQARYSGVGTGWGVSGD